MRDYNKKWDGRERLREWCENLEQKVEHLEEVVKDYDRVRSIFGPDRVDGLLKGIKEQEKIKQEMEKERRKLIRKKSKR